MLICFQPEDGPQGERPTDASNSKRWLRWDHIHKFRDEE